MLVKTLQAIQDNQNFLSVYLSGMSDLWRSGILNFLRERGRTYVRAKDNNSVDLATHSAWAAGYQDCLEDLINFKELYLTPIAREAPKMDFNAMESAVLAGDLTEEEANAIRTGEPINYATHTNSNINVSKSR